MAKVNDELKKKIESFNRQADTMQRQKQKSEKFTPFTTKNLETDINQNTKRMSSFTNPKNYKVNVNEFRQSGVSDNGFNQDTLDNNNILYNTDINNNAPKKMRRIVSSNKSSSSSDYVYGQSKIFGGMFTQQSKLMVRMHSEKMALDTKFSNTMIQYTKNISEQVTQMNKIKNSIQIDFYKNSLTTQSSILEELKSINKTLKTGFNLNDKGEKIPNKEMDSLIRQVFSGGNLRGNAKKAVMQLASEAFNQGSGGAGLALGMLLPLLQSRGGIKSLASFGLKQGLTFGAGKLLGNKFARLMRDPGRHFENMMTAWGLGSGVKGWIGKRLGRQNGGLNTDLDITKYINKDFKGRANFDNAAHTALTKVITRSLANIEASLTGKAAMYYNYATNQFQTIEQAEKTLQTSYTDTLKKQLREARKDLVGGSVKKKKNKFGGGETEFVDKGIFGEILDLDDINDSNLKFIKDMINKRGPQLADALMKIVLFFAERDTDPGSVLDADSLSLSFVTQVMYPKELLDNASSADMNKYMESADHVRRFLTALRNLPGKKAKEIWNKILDIVNETHDATAKAADEAFREAEGGIGQWAAYTYGEVEENGRVRAATRAEIDKKLKDSRKIADISGLRDLQIDLTGVMNEDDLRIRIRDEYNRMCAPLFKGSVEKISKNLKAKAAQLEKTGHFFAPYMRQTADLFAKGGSVAFKDVDYATLAGVENYVDIMKNKAPEFDGRDYSTAIKSAKDIAKWHLENNAKVRGAAGVVMTASYAALIKQMYQSTGMTGPFASSIIGITAASTAVMSGKMHKVMDVMATSIGDEKMVDKNGKETDITKRQAMTEAMYREFLPKMWGQKQGAKLGGWIRNNIRFGPILGPVIGMTTGWILGKGASILLKIGGLFGKVAKFALNKLGQKVTGNKNSMWGDTIRDIARAKLGLPPASTQFTSKDVFNQVGPRKANKWHHLIATFTGQRVEDIMEAEAQGDNPVTERAKKVRKDIETRLREAQAMVRAKHGYRSPLEGNDAEVMSGMGQGYNINNDPLKGIRQSILTVRVVGGHLDAIGAVGVVDSETYSNKMQDMVSKASTNSKLESAVSPQSSPGEKGISSSPNDLTNKVRAVTNNFKNATQFIDNDPEARDETEDQDRQEVIEEKNTENIEKIAKKGFGAKEKKVKEKKKGFFGNLLDVLTGKGNLFSLIGSIPKIIPLLLMGMAFWPQIKGILEKYLPGMAEGGFNVAKFLGKGALDLGFKGASWLGGKGLDLLGKGAKWGIDKLNPMNLVNGFSNFADKHYQKRQAGDILPDGKISLANDLVRMLLLNSTNRKVALGLTKGSARLGWSLTKGIGKLGLKMPGILWNLSPFGMATRLLGINRLGRMITSPFKKAGKFALDWTKDKLLDARTIAGIIGKTGWKSIKNRFAAAGKFMTKDMIEELVKKYGKDGAERFMKFAQQGKFSKKFYQKFAEKATKSSIDMAERGAMFTSKSGVIGKIAGFVMKGVDNLAKVMLKIPGLETLTEKIANKFIPGVKKICEELLEKISGKLAKEAGEKTAKKGFLGAVKGLLTAGGITAVINVAFIAWDAWQGAKKAKDFFAVSEDDQPTGVQKWACAITYALMSLIEAIPGCMIVTSVVSALDGVMKWLCRKVYGTLNMCLNVIGCGDGIQEENDMKILEVGAERDDNGKLFATRDDAQGKYEQIKNRAEDQKKKEPNADKEADDNIDFGYGAGDGNDGGSNSNGSGYDPSEAFKDYAVVHGTGGSGGGSSTSISGSPAKGNVPMFYSQDWLPAGRVGSLDIQSDGCALAVMKMIGAYKGMNISDTTLINKMKEHKLSNRTVSIGFFADFGGQNTRNRDDIRSALLSGNCCMALLISANGSKHFIALISKDKNTLYLGDPMKTAWEEISCNDANLIAHSIAGSVFSGAIVTNIGTPKQLGGSGVGGFGSKAKPINGLYGKSRITNAPRSKDTMINVFNNGAQDYYDDKASTTDTGGSAGAFTGGKDAILKTISKGETGNEDYTSPVVLGRADDDSGPGTYPRTPYDAYGIQGLNTAPGNSWWDFVKSGSLEKLGLNPKDNFIHNKTFREAWKAVANKDPKKMLDVQTDFFFNNYLGLDPNNIGGSISQKTGIKPDIANDAGIMVYVVDMMNQYGRSGGLSRAKAAASANSPKEAMEKMRAVDNFRETGGRMIRVNMRRDYFNKYTGQKGGNGIGTLNNEPLFWGRGSIPLSRTMATTVWITSKDVESKLHLGDNTACGLAAGLMVLRLVYHSKWKDFTPEIIKRWGDVTKSWADNYGVHQNFFRNMGFRPLDIGAIVKKVSESDKKTKGAWRVVRGDKDRKPGVYLKEFCRGSNKLQNGEIAVVYVKGHWMVLANLSPDFYVLNPSKRGPEEWNVYNSELVEYIAIITMPSQLKDITTVLKGKGNSSSSGKKSSGGGSGAGTGGTNTNDTGSVPDNVADTGEQVKTDSEGTPNRGTSASFGGWFWKDKDDNVNQVFFGAKVKRQGNVQPAGNNTQNSSTSSGGPAGPLGLPGSCDAKPGVPVDNTPVAKDSPNMKLAVAARKNHISSKMTGQCAQGVSTIIKIGIGTYPGGHAHTFVGAPVHTSNTALIDHKRAKKGTVTNAKDQSAASASKMEKLGFVQISVTSNPQPGDVLAFTHPTDLGWYGHITCLGDDGNWYSDGPQPGGWYVYNSAGDKSKVRATLWRYKGRGLGGESSKGSASNYYSKGGNQSRGSIDKKVSSKINKAYTKKEDGKGPGIDHDGVLVNELTDGKTTYKTFRFSNDPSRQSSAASRDIIAKAKYDREMRYRDEGRNMQEFGMFKVSYSDKNDVIARSMSTASGYVQDIKSDKPLVNALTRLAGAIADSTVQEKLGTKKLVEQQEKQTEIMRETTEHVETINESTEKLVKANIDKVPQLTEAQKKAELERCFSLIKQAEKEMFVGLNN